MFRVKRVMLPRPIYGQEKPCGVNKNMLLLTPPGLIRGEKINMCIMEEFLNVPVRDAFFEADHCAAENGDVYTYNIDDLSAIEKIHLRIKYLKSLK